LPTQNSKQEALIINSSKEIEIIGLLAKHNFSEMTANSTKLNSKTTDYTQLNIAITGEQ